MGDPYIGTGAVVSIAMNADNSGTYWGGTPATAVCTRVRPAGLKWSEVCKQSGVEQMRVDEAFNVTGGVYYKGSVEMPASYLGLELWIQAIMDGAITDGLTDPYTHTMALAEKLMYCQIIYYTQLRNATAKSKTFTNCKVTGMKFSIEAEKEATVTFDWIGATMAAGNTALGTPTEIEPILWNHLAPSINSVTTHRLYSMGFEIAAPVTEGDFGMAALTPGSLLHIERAGMRTLAIDASFLHDADVDTLAALTTGLPMVFTFDNAGATTTNRKFVLTVGAGYREGREETDAVWGVKKTSLKWTNRKSSAPWGIVTTNSDTAIP